MKITVLNLPRNLTKNDLSKLFEEYGDVETCDLVMDKVTGFSKGFGFVEMFDEEKANNAIENLHGHKIGKNRLRVKAANI